MFAQYAIKEKKKKQEEIYAHTLFASTAYLLGLRLTTFALYANQGL